MPSTILQLARIPARTFFVHLSGIVYVLICLALSGLAVRYFHVKLAKLSTALQLIGLLAGYLVVMAALDSLLAFLFASVCHGRLFGVVRFVTAGLFFVLPATLLIFLVAVWLSRPPALSPIAVHGLCSGLLIVAALLIGTYLYARFVEPYRLQTTFHHIRSPKLAGLDKPLRIVLLADIQTDRITAYEKQVFEKTLELKPDLILLAGDYLQCSSRQSYRRQAGLLQQMLNDLNFTAPLGIFAVPGNAESSNGRDCFDGTKVQWLIDQSTTIDHGTLSICLTGLSLKTGATSDKMAPNLLAGMNEAHFNIVLSHQPDFVLDLPSGHAIDLCLAGHTHGGQICLPFAGAVTTASRIPRSQASGLHRINGTTACISRGIGMERGWAPRLRFFCPPEIVILDLLVP